MPLCTAAEAPDSSCAGDVRRLPASAHAGLDPFQKTSRPRKMTHNPMGRGPLAANDVVNLGDLLLKMQWVTQSKPAATAGLLHILSHKCAPISAPSVKKVPLSPSMRLMRMAPTEVRFKLPVQLRLHQHHPQGIEASAGCCVLAIAFSFGG